MHTSKPNAGVSPANIRNSNYERSGRNRETVFLILIARQFAKICFLAELRESRSCEAALIWNANVKTVRACTCSSALVDSVTHQMPGFTAAKHQNTHSTKNEQANVQKF
ncbi:hypothetical protein VCUG_00461 [Vavraia culicis subsp. floridensis]|uniref:Uncharacterized protein n=1 Tax=Vavraia culicis (isolate floridensis) TaxID=948595 RepID=L2GXL9_VAVCU|nr:uncharacterized protein VCUG_00461 [Vavraia culicis subsp. floridensis]ELA48038.1 hypothetical protein VCUG_00461 [Vavraia culicis subsp. floridensis]